MKRVPVWSPIPFVVAVNGRNENVHAKPGSYAIVGREWETGNTVQARFTMSLRMEAVPDDPSVIALLYGPMVLTGNLGKEGLGRETRCGPHAPPLNRVPSVVVSAFVGTVKDVIGKLRPVTGMPLYFQTKGAHPADVAPVPFYRASEHSLHG